LRIDSNGDRRAPPRVRRPRRPGPVMSVAHRAPTATA
jgi:hypothetical protein